MKNIAVIKGSSLGDAILSVPLLRNLKHNYPEAKITLITEDSELGLEILRNCPYINNIIQIKKQTLTKKIKSLTKVFKIMRKKYDLVVVGMPITKNKLNFTSKIRKNNLLIPDNYKNRDKKIVNTDLQMLKKQGLVIDSGYLEVFFDSNTMNRIRNSKTKKNQIVIYTGRDTDVFRKWNTKKWIQLLNTLPKKYNTFIIGGKDCKNVSKEIETSTNSRALIDDLHLTETAVLIKNSKLMITTNGGPMHLAAALGIPMVVINTSSSKMWYPQNKNAKILQNKCNQPCKNDWCTFPKESTQFAKCQDISVKRVQQAVKAILKKA